MEAISYTYRPSDITSGIIHIGVGNFHRAHQQFYINRLLEYADQRNWGICGVGLLPSDQKIVENLRSQNLEFTVTVCGRDGHDEVHKIASLRELIWGVENPRAIIDKIANPEIKIISLTITEGGYLLNKETHEFNLEDGNILQDLQRPQQPLTVFGYVAEGLRQRMQNNVGGLTILSCDNLQHNGNTAKKAFLSFIHAQDEVLARWVMNHVSFPNSMVDRITPATTEDDVKRLNAASGIEDKAPVYCEDFIQWVIEDDFIAGRPAFERVGVEITNDVTAFENMKLSLLNASHTLLSYPSFLKGYRKVDQAMKDPEIVQFVSDFMDIDMTPYVPAPANTDLAKYKQTLIERFANTSVSDQISRLCFDGISKFPVYIIPNLIKMIEDKRDLTRMAFLVASYRYYLKIKVDDLGNNFDTAEPWLTVEDQQIINSDEVLDFLFFSALRGAKLEKAESFIPLYLSFVKQLDKESISNVLTSVLS